MNSRQRAFAGWLLVVPLLAAPLAQAVPLPQQDLPQDSAQHPPPHMPQQRHQALPSDLWRVYLDARQNNSELAAAQADQAARAEAVPQARVRRTASRAPRSPCSINDGSQAKACSSVAKALASSPCSCRCLTLSAFKRCFVCHRCGHLV